MGGTGIRNPVETANYAYETSRTGTSSIVDAIKGKGSFSMLDHNNQFAEAISPNLRHHDNTLFLPPWMQRRSEHYDVQLMVKFLHG